MNEIFSRRAPDVNQQKKKYVFFRWQPREDLLREPRPRTTEKNDSPESSSPFGGSKAWRMNFSKT
jgi:hypothetical protein